MSEELKPCPFCGGEATTGYFAEEFVVECPNCEFEVSTYDDGPDDPSLKGVAHWNQRAPAWQDMSTAPKDGRLVLAAHEKPEFQNACVVYWESGPHSMNIKPHWRTSLHEAMGENRFTHWMPLPEPPTAQAGEE